MISSLWKSVLRWLPTVGIFAGVEARSQFHSPAWESAAFYCITARVYLTDHALIVTNWDAQTNVFFTTNRFISNVYTWSNATPFTNTWTESVLSGAVYVTKTQTTVEPHRQTNLVLWNAQIVAFDIQQGLQERNDILGGILEQPRLFDNLRDTVLYAKRWISTSCVHFVDVSFSGTNGTFDAEFATNRFDWTGDVWTNRPYTAERFRQYGINRYGSQPFPMLTPARLETICGLPRELRVTNATNTVYGWTVGNFSTYTVSSNVTVTNSVRTWWDYTPDRNLIGLGKPVYSQETTFVWALSVNTNTALNSHELAAYFAANGCADDGDLFSTATFTCMSRPLITPCAGRNPIPGGLTGPYAGGEQSPYETNWWRYVLTFTTNVSGQTNYNLNIYRLDTNSITQTNSLFVNYWAFNSNAPIYSTTFTQSTVFIWTNICKFEPIASATNDTAYGARGITNCLSKMIWTWRPIAWTNSVGYWVPQTGTNSTTFGEVIHEGSTNPVPPFEVTNAVACTDLTIPGSSYSVTNFSDGKYPRSHFLWGRSWMCDSATFDEGFNPGDPGFTYYRQWNFPRSPYSSNWFEPYYFQSYSDEGYMYYGKSYITATGSIVMLTSTRSCAVQPYFAAYGWFKEPLTAGIHYMTNAIEGESIWGFPQWGGTNIIISNTYSRSAVFAAADQFDAAATNLVMFSPGTWQASAPDTPYVRVSGSASFSQPTNEMPQVNSYSGQNAESAGAWGSDLKTVGAILKWDQTTNGLRYK